MQSVRVFARIHDFQNGSGIGIVGQRQLQENAVHLWIGIEFFHQRDEIRHVGRSGQRMMDGFHAGFGAGFDLVGDIRMRGRIIPHEDRGQAGLAARFLGERRDVAFYFRANFSRDRFSVKYASGVHRIGLLY